MKYDFQAPWQLKNIFQILIIVLATFLVLTFALEFSAFKETSYFKDKKGILIAIIIILQGIVMLTPVFLLHIKKQKLTFSDFGLQKIKISRILSLSVQGYLLYIIISALIRTLILYTGIKIPGYQLEDSLMPDLLYDPQLGNLMIIFFIAVILAPVIEELFFRGFLLRSLANRFGGFYASLITAAIFSLSHLNFGIIIPIFILGLIINWLVLRSGSIWPAISFHILNNAIAFIITVLIANGSLSLENIV